MRHVEINQRYRRCYRQRQGNTRELRSYWRTYREPMRQVLARILHGHRVVLLLSEQERTAMLIVLIPLYVLVQMVVLLKVRGGWRWLAALPLLGMLPVALIAALDYADGSELWLLPLVLACPLATVALLGIWGLHTWMARRHGPGSVQ